MPRGVSLLDQALQERRLWTPANAWEGLRAWYDWSDLSTGSFDSSGFTGLADKARRVSLSPSVVRPEVSHRGIRGKRAANMFQTAFMWGSLFVNISLPLVATILIRPRSTTGQFGRFFGFVAEGQAADFNNTGSIAFALRINGGNNIGSFYNNAEAGQTAYTYDSSPTIFSVTISGAGNLQQWLNGRAGTSTSIAGSTFGNGYVTFGCSGAGNQGSNEFADSWFGEAVLYCADDFLLRREQIEGSMAWRFNCQDILDASHRYRNTPPLIGT